MLMTTIAKTKRYQELTYRHLKLIRLYNVMAELRLHTNKGLDIDTAKYYHAKLFVWGSYAPFLNASLESMMQVFYIELDGFIGAYWNPANGGIQQRRYEHGSLAAYLYDGTRTTRKRKAVLEFESLLQLKEKELAMINNVRGNLAHFVKLNPRSKAFVPGDIEVREILDKIAEILFLLGYQRGNKPHYIEQDDESTESTQRVIDNLSAPDAKAIGMRQAYLKARSKWFSKK